MEVEEALPEEAPTEEMDIDVPIGDVNADQGQPDYDAEDGGEDGYDGGDFGDDD